MTKRKDSYYTEFRVQTLRLATNVAGVRLKRWKVGSLNKTTAKQQEAIIKTDLMKGIVQSAHTCVMTFKEWATTCLALEEVRWLCSFNDRRDILQNQLIHFFGGKLLTETKASDVEDFRAQRRKRDGSAPVSATA